MELKYPLELENILFEETSFEVALHGCRTLQRSSRKSSTRSTTQRGIASWGATSART